MREILLSIFRADDTHVTTCRVQSVQYASTVIVLFSSNRFQPSADCSALGCAGAPQSGPMLDDLWSLDTSAPQLVWKREAVGGRAPSPRCSHSAAAVGSDIVFHGGAVYK